MPCQSYSLSHFDIVKAKPCLYYCIVALEVTSKGLSLVLSNYNGEQALKSEKQCRRRGRKTGSRLVK